jgi:hypothetical protein
MRVDGDAALPLAVLVLSQSRTGSSRRLDERDLSALRRRAGHAAAIGRYVGYYDMYATSHAALDRDGAFQEEVRNAARALAAELALQREGRKEPDAQLQEPRPK